MATAKSISHEQLASLWLALNNGQDSSVHIRESSGHHVLEAGHQEESTSYSRSLLTYAVELTVIFDFIRTSNCSNNHASNTGRNEKEQRYIIWALTYLLQKIEPQAMRNGVKGMACSHILLRTIVSALCALSALPVVDKVKGMDQLALAAQGLGGRIPQEGENFRFLRDLSWYLIATSSSNYQGSRHLSSCALRNGTHLSRSEVIEQLVDLATSVNTNPIERVKSIIEICHAYWESDATLIRSCSANNSGREAQSGPDSVQAMAAALESRYLIQEHLMNANLEDTTEGWVQALTPSLMSIPLISQSCALDTCQCAFGAYQSYILGIRKQRSKFLRHSLQRVYSAETPGDDSSTLREVISSMFNDRLESAASGSLTACATNSETTPSQSTTQTQTTPQCGPSFKADDLSPSPLTRSPEQTRPGLPKLIRYYSQYTHAPVRDGSYSVNDISAHKHLDNAAPQSPPPLSDSGGGSSSQHSRADSITTITSSRDGANGAFSESLLASEARKESQESYKIVVEAPRGISINSPGPIDKSFPEVVVFSEASDNFSLLSESSIPATIFSKANAASKGRWGNLLRSKRDTSFTFSVPKFRFFASGKHIMLWTKYGGGIIDPMETSGHDFIPIREADITHVAGGTSKFVTISRVAENYRLSIYKVVNVANVEKIGGWDLPKNPGAIDFSRNDQYLAIKYTRSLHLYNLQQPGTLINHKLPSHDTSQPGVGNHLVSFATDSQSFMAATRFQPERVYVYWSLCAQSTTILQQVATTTAPFGNVEDHGLTSLLVCGHTARSYPNAFLSTFTEKGCPALVNMNHKLPAVRLLRDHKEQIGTRIHDSALSQVDTNTGRADLVLINQNNYVFWISDVFGANCETRHVTTLKRGKSLKNEVQVAVSDVDEASIFWIDKQSQKGVLVKVGKNGGKANPVFYRLDVEPMCGG